MQEYEYSIVLSSRKVIKKVGEESILGKSYYNEDIWSIVGEELKGKVEPGTTLYYEIVGYLPSGKMIQKDYDYNCDSGGNSVRKQITQQELDKLNGFPTPNPENAPMYFSYVTKPEHKFLVYRITYTKPDGSVIEFSWQQIKDYCKKYTIEHVKKIAFGNLSDICYRNLGMNTQFSFEDNIFLDRLQSLYLEKDCKYCLNKVPAEGICIRIDGKETFSTFKLKSKRFLEKETKELDTNTINIEDEA